MKVKIIENKKCLINLTTDLVSVLKLKNYPLTEFFGKFEKKFPSIDQEILISKSSGHFQIKYFVDPKFLYNKKNYKFRTSASSKDQINEFIKYTKKILKKKKIKHILDVGGNDSYIINSISNPLTKKYIIDPVTKKIHGIKIINKLINDVNLIKDIKPCDVIICRHTLEHLVDPVNFLRKLLNHSHQNCDFIFEVPSVERMMSQLRFDTINHQHISYFSIETLKILINKSGGVLKNYQIYNNGPCGGSILFHFKKKIKYQPYKKVKISKNFFIKKKIFQKQFLKFTKKLKNLKNSINKSESKIFCYGAALALSTYLYFLKINHSKIKVIIDDDKRKNNLTYKNIKLKVKYIKYVKNLENQNFLITSLENRNKIYKKILKLNPKTVN